MGNRTDYSKGLYKQFEELYERFGALESIQKEEHKELTFLKQDVVRLNNKTAEQQETISVLKAENADLKANNEALIKENQLLRDDNERMKRTLGNNSKNSSLPPSKDGTGKPANTYNSRKQNGRNKGGQPGHKGTTLNRKDIEKKISEGLIEIRESKQVGTGKGIPVVRYVLDLETKVVATKVLIYPDSNGKYQIPEGLNAEVSYGGYIKAIVSYLYGEGVVANDRICDFINSLSHDVLGMSGGTVYSICRRFSELCREEETTIRGDLLNSEVLCTDATEVSESGKKRYIRNFSNERSVLYCYMERKNLAALKELDILTRFTGIFEHDHETALYHFGTGHGECNVHLCRYLIKNTEETKNRWSRDMMNFLNGLNEARKQAVASGKMFFLPEELARYEARYEAILADADRQKASTRGKVARAEEKALINRLRKYKQNHLLFLYDFRVPYSDNTSERDLRKCKNRQKMSGGFRSPEGGRMFCSIMSVIQTIKRRKMNILDTIAAKISGNPVLG